MQDSIFAHLNSIPDKRVSMALRKIFQRILVETPAGVVSLRTGGPLIMTQSDPQTATNTATLTTAQMTGGILAGTPTGAAAYTMPTGTALKASMPQLQPGDSFNLTIINLGATGVDITLTASTDITIVGDPVIRPGADSGTEQAGQATFLMRYTGGTTFIAYRIA